MLQGELGLTHLIMHKLGQQRAYNKPRTAI